MTALWEQLDVMDTYTYVIVCPFGMLASLALVIVQIATPSLRKQPGDLITVIAGSEFFLSLHWFASALRTEYLLGESYDSTGLFCKINSYVAVVAATADTVYNLALLVYALVDLQNVLSAKETQIQNKWIHAAAISIIAVVVWRSELGRNSYGTCSMVVGQSGIVAGAIMIFSMIILGALALNRTENALPELFKRKMGKFRRDFLGYYKSYFQALMLIYSLIFFSYCCQLFGINENNPDTNPSERNLARFLFNLGRFGNTAKALWPLVLFSIRASDPALSKQLGSRFGGVSDAINLVAQLLTVPGVIDTPDSILEDVESVLPDASIMGDSGAAIRNPLKRSGMNSEIYDTIQQELEMETKDTLWLALLPIQIKSYLTKTMIAGIYKEYPDLLSKLEPINREIRPADKNDFLQFEIFDEAYRESTRQKEGILDCTMVVYWSTIFKKIIDESPRKVDFAKSLDVMSNRIAIQQAGQDKGGASGALQLKTHDDRLILKTMSDPDFQELMKIIPAYANHLCKHPDSLIGRIFGVFEFRFAGSDKPLRVMLMECLAVFPKQDILRKYDLKGSTHRRQVLEDDYINSINIDTSVPGTLKDLDFSKIEHSVTIIDKSHLDRVTKAIFQDSQFFQTHKLIDYSLLVTVIKITPQNKERIEKESSSGTCRFLHGHSISQQGMQDYLYMIGIIDYLQYYTWAKAFERIFRRIMKCKLSLETSIQPPKTYASRFANFFSNSFH